MSPKTDEQLEIQILKKTFLETFFSLNYDTPNTVQLCYAEQ
jgi:hypothetical protein